MVVEGPVRKQEHWELSLRMGSRGVDLSIPAGYPPECTVTFDLLLVERRIRSPFHEQAEDGNLRMNKLLSEL